MKDSACVGCRFAKWFDHAPDYGTCEHPIAIEVRRPRPLSVFDMNRPMAQTIDRTWYLSSDAPVCPTREDTP